MNWTQFFEINKKSSNVLPINYGVSEGPVLGWLLFLICINDLNNAVTHLMFHHFEVDTNMFNDVFRGALSITLPAKLVVLERL